MAGLVSSQIGASGADLRRKIGDMQTKYADYLRAGTFSTNLLAIYTTAVAANAKLSNLVALRNYLFTESPVGLISNSIVQTALYMCLSAESRLIVLINFTSRDAVVDMINTMRDAFDTARVIAADSTDNSAYQNLTFLAGALTNYLANTARPLPRIVTFNLAKPFPSLALSNLIYYDAGRSDEIVDENHIVHPAFCPRQIRGLAS
jgi:prophage DNA circulation protein